MQRRAFCGGLLAGGATLAVGGEALAEGFCGNPQCNPWTSECVRQCTVGLPTGFIQYVRAAKQQQASQWCWAACIQMVFAAHGFKVPQQVFVQQTFGGIVDMPGQPHQILAALNREYVDTDGKRFRAHGDSFSVNLATARDDLFNRQPLIVGALGHATVLTALSWVENNMGATQVTQAVVRDPWPGNPSKRLLAPQEWFNIMFAARVRCEALPED